MSTFDQASLVMIPSGYNTSKIYSVKPTDGSGDMSFSRSNDTATRVNSAGLIEKVRTNNIIQSQALATTWSVFEPAGAGTIIRTNNYAAAPDGTMTATRIQNTGASNAQLVFQNLATSPSVISIYAKRTGATDQKFRLFGQNGATQSADLTATDTWQRFILPIGVGVSLPLGIQSSSTADTYDILFWGAQVEDGDIATQYIATTSAAVSVGPVANVPRLDYLNSSCPRLLLEPQRTNLKLYSENFSAAAGWSPLTNGDSSVTFTANYGVSPDGYQNADRLQLALNTGSFVDWLSYNAVTIGTTYTYSIYAKSLSGSVDVEILGGTPTGNIKKTITTEWTRLTHTFTATNGDLYPRFLLQAGTSSSADILVWGAQLEAGAYATSYIPTLGAAVTRGADACSKTGISSLIGQTEGTLFFEGVYGNEAEEMYLFLQNGSASGADSSIYIQRASNSILFRVWNASSLDVSIIGGTFTVGQSIKIAAAYKANDFVLYVNGVQIGTDTSGAVPACARLQLASYFSDPTNNVYIARQTKQALLFKTRLTNAQLAELTTI